MTLALMSVIATWPLRAKALKASKNEQFPKVDALSLLKRTIKLKRPVPRATNS